MDINIHASTDHASIVFAKIISNIAKREIAAADQADMGIIRRRAWARKFLEPPLHMVLPSNFHESSRWPVELNVTHQLFDAKQQWLASVIHCCPAETANTKVLATARTYAD